MAFRHLFFGGQGFGAHVDGGVGLAAVHAEGAEGLYDFGMGSWFLEELHIRIPEAAGAFVGCVHRNFRHFLVSLRFVLAVNEDITAMDQM